MYLIRPLASVIGSRNSFSNASCCSLRGSCSGISFRGCSGVVTGVGNGGNFVCVIGVRPRFIRINGINLNGSALISEVHYAATGEVTRYTLIVIALLGSDHG